MSFEVHKEPLYRRYYATPTSAACCYAVLYGFLVVFLPLIIAYNSSSFWLKDNITYEQPTVSYRYDTIIQLGGTTITASSSAAASPSSLTLYYSTSPFMNTLYEEYVRHPILRSVEVDSNADGRTDRLEINVVMPLAPQENIHTFTAFILHDVQFDGKTKMVMDAATYIQHSEALAMTALDVDGDVVFKQTWPMHARGGYRTPYEADPLLPSALNFGLNTLSAEDVAIRTLLGKYAARNFTTHFNPRHIYAETRSTSAFHADESVASRQQGVTPFLPTEQRVFNATITLRIPEAAVRYTPAVSEVLKSAWIQYISFFIITSFLLHRLTSFVFRNQLIHSYGVVDVMSNKND